MTKLLDHQQVYIFANSFVIFGQISSFEVRCTLGFIGSILLVAQNGIVDSFITICNFFSCDKKGFIGTLGRLIIFLTKAFVTLPALGGTMKLDKYLFEDGNAERYFKKIEELVRSKICKSGKFHSS